MRDDEWYTVPEAATILKVAKKTVYEYMNEGKLAYSQMSARRRRIKGSELRRFLEAGSSDRIGHNDRYTDDIRTPSLAAA